MPHRILSQLNDNGLPINRRYSFCTDGIPDQACRQQIESFGEWRLFRLNPKRSSGYGCWNNEVQNGYLIALLSCEQQLNSSISCFQNGCYAPGHNCNDRSTACFCFFPFGGEIQATRFASSRWLRPMENLSKNSRLWHRWVKCQICPGMKCRLARAMILFA